MTKVCRYVSAATSRGAPRKMAEAACWPAPRTPRTRERGAISIMTAGSLALMLTIIAFAVELGLVYNRKLEMSNVADAVALAAANQLNGSPAGITNALAAAKETAEALAYGYGKPVRWTNDAIQFGPSPEGDWTAGGTMSGAQAAPLLYVRVDTSQLDADHRRVDTPFMGAMAQASATSNVGTTAIAGRSTINVTPFGICAMSPVQAAARVNPGTVNSVTPSLSTPNLTELVEHGFRRGVSYDLMQLSPNSTTPANFVINPVAPPGTLGSSTHTSASFVAPFICSGSMAMRRVTGQPITVTGPFPLSSLFLAFNSRFNQYTGGPCKAPSASPDENVKSYLFGSIPWMTAAATKPTVQSAAATNVNGRRETIADLDPAPYTNTAPNYGPLWSFARAVPFSAYVAGQPEPAEGYPTFATTDWKTLYKPTADPLHPPTNPPPAAGASYPNDTSATPPITTPYGMNSGNMFSRVVGTNWPGVRSRRVLNVPLLRCPISANATVNAEVLAIGKFFMTVPATTDSLVAEFGGLANEQSLGGKVELY